MPLRSRVAAAWRTLFRKGRLERELDEEMRAAQALLEERHRGAGMPDAEARRAARIALGGVDPVKEEIRAVFAAPRHLDPEFPGLSFVLDPGAVHGRNDSLSTQLRGLDREQLTDPTDKLE